MREYLGNETVAPETLVDEVIEIIHVHVADLSNIVFKGIWERYPKYRLSDIPGVFIVDKTTGMMAFYQDTANPYVKLYSSIVPLDL